MNVDPSNHALSPALTVLGKTPYVAWTEMDSNGVSTLHVKHWKRNTWVPDGNKLNLNPGHHAMSPTLAWMGSTLYLGWAEYDDNGISQIHVKHLEGDHWVSDDQNLNTVPPTYAATPTLSSSKSELFIAWKELYKHGLSHIIAKRVQVP